MQARNTALEIFFVEGEILLTYLIVKTFTRAAHTGHDIIAHRRLFHLIADLHHAPEIFMAQHKKFRTLGRSAVLRVIYLAVGAARAHPQHFDQHSAPFRHIRHFRLVHLDQMNRACFFWNYRYSFHIKLIEFLEFVGFIELQFLCKCRHKDIVIFEISSNNSYISENSFLLMYPKSSATYKCDWTSAAEP